MKKSTKVLKKFAALFLLVLMSIESFAAIVGDSDGAAFLTKQEFENMKQGFDDAIVRYNNSIDNKIDGAIAGYLSGLLYTRLRDRNTLNSGRWETISTRYSTSDYTWRYKYGSPRIQFVDQKTAARYDNSASDGRDRTRWQSWCFKIDFPSYDATKHAIHKLAIQNVSRGRNTAEWYGISYGAHDDIVMRNNEFNYGSFTLLWGITPTEMVFAPFRHSCDVRNCDTYYGQSWYNMGMSQGNAETTGLGFEFPTNIRQVIQNWGTIKNQKIILLSDSKKYRNFSHYPTSHNLCFWTTDTTDASSYEKLWQSLSGPGAEMGNEFKNCFSATGTSDMISVTSGSSTIQDGQGGTLYLGKHFRSPGRTDAYGGSEDGKKACGFPCLGFEHGYITNWNQLWTSYFDTVARDEVFSDTDRNKFLIGADNNYHIGLKNGLPLIKVPSNETKFTIELDLDKISYNVLTGAETIEDPTTDCYVWISDEPFTGWPNSNESLEWVSLDGNAEKTTTTNYTEAIKIPASKRGKAKVQFTAYTKDKYIWIKWTIDGQYGGGALNVPKTIRCEEMR